MHLLIVEDDKNVVRSILPALKQQGYVVELADNGVDGEFAGCDDTLDLIILDLGLPGRNGLEVLRNWRKNAVDTPVLILTARDAWHERVDGLKAGADDYLGKPFHTEELLARIDALVRRSYGHSQIHIQQGALVLNTDEQTATDKQGKRFELTGVEFRLLRYLMLNADKVLSKTLLSEHVYEEALLRDSNVIEVYINHLRQYFGKDLIITKRGQGYSFNSAASACQETS